MASKEARSEVAYNQVWRESINRENVALRKQVQVYSCNLRALSKERTTGKAGARKEDRMILTDKQDEEASFILEQYGHKTKVEDPLVLRVPRTTNSAYGALYAYAIRDARAAGLGKSSCDETKYGQNYFKMAGKSAFSNKV